MTNLSAKESRLAAELDLQTSNQQRHDWKAIAAKLGYKSPRVAMEMAKRLKNKTSGGGGAQVAKAKKHQQDLSATKEACQKPGSCEEERTEKLDNEAGEEQEEREGQRGEETDDEDEEYQEDEDEKEVMEDEQDEEEEEEEGEKEGQRNGKNAANRKPGWWLKPVEA